MAIAAAQASAMVGAIGRGLVAACDRLPVVIAEATCHARSKPGVAVQRMGSATVTLVIWVGHECQSLEFGAERPARTHDHCRAPNRWAPCSTGMPQPSVEPATPPTDCGSPKTTAAGAVHDPEQERQTA